MLHHATSSVFQPRRIQTMGSRVDSLNAQTMTEERLAFTVRLVRNEEDLNKAVQIRHSAYARHMPAVAETLIFPEKADTEDGVVVLLAESKLDGSPLGTVRIQTNRYQPLSLEKSVDLPAWLMDQPLAQVSRLGITQGIIGRMVKIILVKASFQYCEHQEIRWAMVAARAPLDRQYAQLMFEDVFPGSKYIPLPHMNNVPHRVMQFEIETGKSRWTEACHPLLKFFCDTYHPDIAIDDSDITGSMDMVKPFSSWGYASARKS